MNLHTHAIATVVPLWLDGSDGQEDELEDVQKGELQPSSEDEVPGDIFESNKVDPELQKEMEEGNA